MAFSRLKIAPASDAWLTGQRKKRAFLRAISSERTGTGLNKIFLFQPQRLLS